MDLANPLLKKPGDEYPAVRDALRCIAAEECYACVEEFLEMMAAARGGGTAGEEEDSSANAESETQFKLKNFLEENSEHIADLSERYMSAEDLPGIS